MIRGLHDHCVEHSNHAPTKIRTQINRVERLEFHQASVMYWQNLNISWFTTPCLKDKISNRFKKLNYYIFTFNAKISLIIVVSRGAHTALMWYMIVSITSFNWRFQYLNDLLIRILAIIPATHRNFSLKS